MRVDDVLTTDAVSFLTDLEREFGERRRELLARRAERLRRLTGGGLASGELPDFLPDTAGVRGGEWRIAPFPEEIADRRVEITGPVDRKMVINALNSGAKVFMADFEDANSPTWENCIEGQRNLTDALERTIELDQGVGFRQVPAARAHHQGRDLVLQRIGLAGRRVGEADLAGPAVLQVRLALDHVRPRRRGGVLEVGHEHLRA